MDNILLTVRHDSSRLLGKCMLPFSGMEFGEENVLEHVILRSIFPERRLIVCTGTSKSNDNIVSICKNLGVETFRGSDENKISRWFSCFKFFSLDFAHLLDADDVFFCNDEISHSIELFKNTQVICAPSLKSSSGNASVGFTLGLEHIQELNLKVGNKTKFEIIDQLVFDIFKDSIVRSADLDPIPFGTRLTLDYFEDYIMLSAIKLLLNRNASRKQINQILISNPWLITLNTKCNTIWKKRQLGIIENQRLVRE